jgi:transposase
MRMLPDNFYKHTKSARKIMVVDLGFLGDSVHLVPALWEIKRHYPEAQLHTLSATVGAELLGLARCVDVSVDAAKPGVVAALGPHRRIAAGEI